MTYTQDPPPEGTKRGSTKFATVTETGDGRWKVQRSERLDRTYGMGYSLPEIVKTQAEAERIAKEWVGFSDTEEE